VPLDQRNIPQIIDQATDALRVYDISLPPDIAMLSKTCVTLEGFGRLLYPQFDLMSEAQELLKTWGKERYKPATLVRKLGLRAFNYMDSWFDESETLTPQEIAVTAPALDRQLIELLARRQERLRYRQIQIMATIGFLLASCLLMLLPEGPKLWGMHVVGIVSFLGSVGVLNWLLLATWWGYRSTE